MEVLKEEEEEDRDLAEGPSHTQSGREGGGGVRVSVARHITTDRKPNDKFYQWCAVNGFRCDAR